MDDDNVYMFQSGPCGLFMVWKFRMNLPICLSLEKKVLTHLWEIRRERDFRTRMGPEARAKLLGSNSLVGF